MIRIELQVELSYEIGEHGADFIFNIHAAHTPSQTISAERLALSQPIDSQIHTDPVTGNRYMRVRAVPGPLTLSYAATVDLAHHRADAAQLAEVPIRHLPPEVIGYLYPSRYCQSDRLVKLAIKEFGALWQGHSRVQAIRDWVQRRVTFTSNTSNSNTSAVDTLIEQVGVCRDFAHLMIALCRAVNIPARFATGTDYGADPALGPPDFHAYVEAYLGDRWYIFDPSGTAIPMGFVRFGTGRDAADVAFATIFGTVRSSAPRITIEALPGADGFSALGFGASVTWDSRDQVLWPTRGAFAQGWYLHFPSGIGRNDGYSRGSAEARIFLPLGRGRVLGLAAFLEEAHGATPFTLLPKLGSTRYLRGIREGRYRDRVAWAAQAELRLPLAGRVAGAVFGSFGDVGPDLEALTADTLKVAGGAGLRLRLTDQGANLRLDVAGSGTGPEVYLLLLEAF